ncbi:hypothetical protein M0802_011023 [Mischocyttarus mexicanus]|nr:hypothetical protein M0802_011023 [Mischocyttarus mexicanus]
MGNAGSNQAVSHSHNHPGRDRHGKEHAPSSPGKEGQAFVFDKKPDQKLVFQSSNEEDEPYYTKDKNNFGGPRPRSNTVSEGTKVTDSKVLPTVFKWEGGGKQVYISGTFTGWKTLPMVKSHGDFVTIIDLPEGEHQYKFYVDGEWRHDPGLKIIDNGMGSKNNLVAVRKSDFEVFQALAKDSEGVSSSIQTEYGQEIPPLKPWEKVVGPPILPPHLLQVILNKDTPLSCEPTLLPEPNHVMLNHLYALSIKDSLNVSFPATGCQKLFEISDEHKLRMFYEKRMGAEVEADSLGDEWKGYVVRISGGNDKQGFPMKQGILTNGRVRLLLSKGHSCYRPRRDGERKRKSVRGCIVDANLSVLALVIVKKGEQEIPGLTDTQVPRRLGPKRASKIRKLFNLSKEDDVRQFVVKRPIQKEGKKERLKAPKIQRLITPLTLQRRRHRRALKKRRCLLRKEQAADYAKLLAQRQKEAKNRRKEEIKRRRSASMRDSKSSNQSALTATQK